MTTASPRLSTRCSPSAPICSTKSPEGLHVQKDMGIRLGWDDEQLLIWQNRQVLSDPATPGARIDAPLGVFTYRLDVRKKDQADLEFVGSDP